MSDKVQTIGEQPTPAEALKEIANEGMNHFAAPTLKAEAEATARLGVHASILESTPSEVDPDVAVDGYVDEAKATAEELQSLYTEQGAADALYKQISSATNMMLDASLELTNKAIDEQVALIEKVIDDEKAKGELADPTAIAQAEQVLATVAKFKDDEFRKQSAYRESAEKAPELYDYIKAQLTDKKKLIRLYRTPVSDTQLIRICEHMCRIFALPLPLNGAHSVIGLETVVTSALSNILNTPRKYGMESMAKFVYSELTTTSKREVVMTKAVRFVVRFIAEHTRHFLVKNKKVEDRRTFQFLIVEEAVTAITYDEALNPTCKITPVTEGFTELVAELLRVYFTDIKVNSLK